MESTLIARPVKRKKPFDFLGLIIKIVLVLAAILTLFPIVYCFVCSITDAAIYSGGGIWLIPKNPTFNSYLVIFKDHRFWQALKNSTLRLVIGTIASVAFTTFVSYCMASPLLHGRKVFYKLSIFTMFFSGGLIPFFCLVVGLNLYNNFLVYILPSLYSVYNMIILSNAFKAVPPSLRESAIIDGANEFQIFVKIYIPLTLAPIATVALWVAVGHWNAYMATMIYTKADELITLQYYLLKLIKEAGYLGSSVLPSTARDTVSADTIKFAGIIISVIPMLAVYPFIQRYFTKGVLLGAEKE